MSIRDYLNKHPIQRMSICKQLVGVMLINKQNYTENIAFSETGNPLDEKSPPKIPNVKSIRTSEWKLILNEYDDTKELYNISKDPFEKDNLIGKKPDIESKLWAEFLKIERKSLV